MIHIYIYIYSRSRRSVMCKVYIYIYLFTGVYNAHRVNYIRVFFFLRTQIQTAMCQHNRIKKKSYTTADGIK